MNIESKMQNLIAELNAASDAYYSGSGELMSDHEWNHKFDELKQLEDESGIVLDGSPTHKVSDFKSSGTKVKHEFPALSLPKSKSIDDVVKWANNKAVNLSWKLDGMTLVAYYDNGKLSKLVTRGDGLVGDDITHLAKAIGNLKTEISYKGHLVIRGEAVISYPDFKRFNDDHDNAYENPRNLTAGSLNPKSTIDIVKERSVTWIPFTLVHVDDDIVSWNNRMQFLQNIGFKTVESVYIDQVSDIEKFIYKWSDQESINAMIYPVDGLVVVYDDTEYASHGSLTGHHDTRGGFAFKWQDEEEQTVLDHIEWSASVNSINPVAVFEPVRLEGTTVQRASLCNISECKRLGIGDKGTELTVIKANKIIPKVIKAKQVGDLTIPTMCPVCNAKTEVKASIDTGIEVLVCTNDDCSAKNIRKLTRFVSKHGFDIQGLSERTIDELINFGFVDTAVDILKLPENKDALIQKLLTADGWGEKSIDNLLNAIELSRNNISSNKFLYSLCIPMCGRDVSKRLTNKYTLTEIINKAISGDILLLQVDGIGYAKAGAIIDWFKIEANRDLVFDLLKICNVKDSVVSVNDLIFEDTIFVVTGSLNNYKSRDDLKAEIESLGGKVSGSVSRNTSYLINNDTESMSSKNKKAKELGIPIISENEYINIKNYRKGNGRE